MRIQWNVYRNVLDEQPSEICHIAGSVADVARDWHVWLLEHPHTCTSGFTHDATQLERMAFQRVFASRCELHTPPRTA